MKRYLTMTMNRRAFGHLVAGGFAVTVASRAAQTSSATLPDPRESGIEHVVVVTMENRSFDHFFGWIPGADGRQAGLQ
jgi:phospholipase C